MRTFLLGGLALGLFAIACAPTPPKKQLIVTDDDGTGPPSASDRNSDSDLGAGVDEAPTDDGTDKTPTSDNAAPSTDGGTASDACGWWCPPTESRPDKAVTCVSNAEGNTSVAVINYSEEDGMIRVGAISVNVSNKNARNKNNANVFMKYKGFNTYSPMIQTGDILKDATTVALTVPANFAFAKGGSIKIDTIFDDSFGDPTGSCEVTP